MSNNDTSKSELDILTAAEAADEIGVTERVILAAFQSGDLAGRNHKGRKGWTTTRGALTRWVESGNQQSEEEGTAFE